MSIRVLPDHVVDRIAAGEVVERPASVLKELVENSLDAGATQLAVHLKAGGIAMVRVVDDGKGMDADDALLCLERHATSKIRAAEDLVGVTTYGFRGEALPSIASVSRFTLRTRRHEDEVGTEVRVDGGTLEHVGPVACPPGTDIAVRSIFHHVPARRRFLRTQQTELSHCSEQIVRQLLRRPDVAIEVRHDGREILRAPATDDAARRIRDLLGPDAAELLPVDHTAAGVRVTGWIAPIGVHRATSTGAVYTFVRGRFVRDPVVRRGVTDAVRGRLPKGRHPLVVIDVDVPAAEVDVNVHPAKTEVRFQRPRQVIQAVATALAAALEGPRPAALPRRGVVDRTPDEQLDLLRKDVPPPTLSAMPPAALGRPTHAVTTQVPGPRPDPMPAPPAEVPEPAPTPAPTAPPAAAEPAPIAADRPTHLHDLVLLGPIALTDTGVAIDLPALQRALTHHQLTATPAVPSQPLLAPRRIRLAKPDAATLLAHVDVLSSLGLDLGAFGPGELAILALPSDVPVDDPDTLLPALAAVLPDRDAAARVLASASSAFPDDAYGIRTLWASAHEAGLELTGIARSLDPDTVRAWIAEDG